MRFTSWQSAIGAKSTAISDCNNSLLGFRSFLLTLALAATHSKAPERQNNTRAARVAGYWRSPKRSANFWRIERAPAFGLRQSSGAFFQNENCCRTPGMEKAFLPQGLSLSILRAEIIDLNCGAAINQNHEKSYLSPYHFHSPLLIF